MNFFNLFTTSRRSSTKIIAFGKYSVMIIDIIQGLVFVPLYITYMGERLYGLWLGTGGILAVLAFFDMGIATLTIQRISSEYGKKNLDGVSKYFLGGILINSVFLFVLFLTGMGLSFWIGSLFPDTTILETELLTSAFQIALIALVFSLLNNTVEGTLNALQKPLISKIFQLISAITGLFVVYFLLLGNQPLLAIPIGLLVRNSLCLFPNLIFLFFLFIKNQIRFLNYNKDVFKDYLYLTPTLMLSKFGSSLAGNLEPTLINLFISAEVAVYFSVTKKAGVLLKTILDRLGGILYPSFAHLYGEENNKYFSDVVLKINRMLFPVILIFFISYALLNQSFVTIWVGSEHYLGDLMTLLIALSLFMSFYSNILGYLLSSTGEIKFTSNVIFVESLTKIILLLLGLKFFGIYGLPLAIIFSSLGFILVYLKKWNKYLQIPDNFQYKYFLKTFAIFLFCSVVCYFILRNIDIINFQRFIFLATTVFSLFAVQTIIFCSDYYKWTISKFKKYFKNA